MIKSIIKDFFKDDTRILFVILILSTIVLPITYSRYIESDSGSARSALAKWDVSIIEDTNGLELVARNTSSTSYTLKVTSTSEVACDYTIAISEIPANVTLTIDGIPYTPDEYGVVIKENLGGFNVNSSSQTNTHILTFSSNSSLTATGNITMDLQVDIKQRIS